VHEIVRSVSSAGVNATMMPEPELGQADLISEPMTLPSSRVEEEGSYRGC
jgi:hypothetical protein